jgi:hypothetical protein
MVVPWPRKHIFSEFVGFEIVPRRERRDLQLGVGGGRCLTGGFIGIGKKWIQVSGKTGNKKALFR